MTKVKIRKSHKKNAVRHRHDEQSNDTKRRNGRGTGWLMSCSDICCVERGALACQKDTMAKNEYGLGEGESSGLMRIACLVDNVH